MTWPVLSKLRSLLRPGLSARIAHDHHRALVALQFLALGLFFLRTRASRGRSPSTGALARRSSRGCVSMRGSAGPARSRDAALEALPHSQWLSLDWSEDIQKPRPAGLGPSATIRRLTSTLRSVSPWARQERARRDASASAGDLRAVAWGCRPRPRPRSGAGLRRDLRSARRAGT